MKNADTETVRRCKECGRELPPGSRSDMLFCFETCRTMAFRRNHGIDRKSKRERRNG